MSAKIEAHSPYALARLAECADPDSVETSETSNSPGAAFLVRVRDDVVERLDELDDDRSEMPADIALEVADSAVPISTHAAWQTFVDLAAYRDEALDEMRADVVATDLEATLVRPVLFEIATRLAYALISEYDAEQREREAEQQERDDIAEQFDPRLGVVPTSYCFEHETSDTCTALAEQLLALRPVDVRDETSSE